MDAGQKQTDKLIKSMEKEIRKVYEEANKEVKWKLDNYLRKFEAKDKVKRGLLAKGKITKSEYTRWRTGQIMIGKRWREMENVLAKDLTNANKIAASVINKHTPEAYAVGRNYATFEVETGSLLNTSFSLYNRHTVERLLRDNPALLPRARVNIPKDMRWNKKRINSAVLQSIIQGEDVNKLGGRLKNVTDMCKHSAIRNARTMITSAENGGRLDSYKAAGDMGIEMEKQWVATLDNRTRHTHAAQDGEQVKVDEEFSNGLQYPADPDGDPSEVYNCRCTMVAVVGESNNTVHPDNVRRSSKLKGMKYEEWLKNHKEMM